MGLVLGTDFEDALHIRAARLGKFSGAAGHGVLSARRRDEAELAGDLFEGVAGEDEVFDLWAPFGRLAVRPGSVFDFPVRWLIGTRIFDCKPVGALDFVAVEQTSAQIRDDFVPGVGVNAGDALDVGAAFAGEGCVIK